MNVYIYYGAGWPLRRFLVVSRVDVQDTVLAVLKMGWPIVRLETA